MDFVWYYMFEYPLNNKLLSVNNFNYHDPGYGDRMRYEDILNRFKWLLRKEICWEVND